MRPAAHLGGTAATVGRCPRAASRPDFRNVLAVARPPGGELRRQPQAARSSVQPVCRGAGGDPQSAPADHQPERRAVGLESPRARRARPPARAGHSPRKSRPGQAAGFPAEAGTATAPATAKTTTRSSEARTGRRLSRRPVRPDHPRRARARQGGRSSSGSDSSGGGTSPAAAAGRAAAGKPFRAGRPCRSSPSCSFGSHCDKAIEFYRDALGREVTMLMGLQGVPQSGIISPAQRTW